MPCNRSSPSTKRFIKNPDLIHQDSNPTNVFTQPGPLADLPLAFPEDRFAHNSGPCLPTSVSRH